MGEPVVFVSHLRVRPGKLADVRALNDRIVESIKADKPLTDAFLAYLSDDGSEMTIVHLFTDAKAMDVHFGGADERSAGAYELLEQVGWEIYGKPSGDALATLEAGAAATDAHLTLVSEWLGGFIRPGSRTPR